MKKIAANYNDDDEFDAVREQVALEAMRTGKPIMGEFKDGVLTVKTVDEGDGWEAVGDLGVGPSVGGRPFWPEWIRKLFNRE
jgi:hypothetical protein